MESKLFVLIFVTMVIGYGEGVQPSNYDISRNRIGGFGLKWLADYILGGGYYGYPNYPGQYPGSGYYPGGGGGYPGQYPGGHHPGGHHPGGHYPGPAGPPGAHPGCPLCDSSVYSYCSHKQVHDSCCCDGPAAFMPFGCRKSDCKFLYANSCEEYNLITDCCCVDLQKSAADPVVPAAVVGKK